VIRRILGRTYHRQGQLELAREQLSNSVAILQKMNDELDLARAYYDYALVTLGMDDNETGRSSLLKAHEIYERLQLPQEQAKVQAVLHQFE